MADATIKARLEADIAQLKSALGESNEMVKKLRQENDKLSGSFKKCQNQADSSSGSFVGLASKGSALAAGWISISTAADALKNTISSTQSTADSFGRTMEAINQVCEHLFQSIATGDFSNLIAGFSEAAQAGRELYDAMDAIFEGMNNLEVKRAVHRNRILEQRRIIEDVRSTPEQRATAQKRIEKINAEQKETLQYTEALVTNATMKSLRAGAGLYGTAHTPEDVRGRSLDINVPYPKNLTKEFQDRYLSYVAGESAKFNHLAEQFDNLKRITEMGDHRFEAQQDSRGAFVGMVNKVPYEYSGQAMAKYKKLAEANPEEYIIYLMKNTMSDEEQNRTKLLRLQAESLRGEVLESEYQETRTYNKMVKRNGSATKLSKKSEPSYAEGSIGDYERQLKKLQEKLRSTTSESSRGAIRQEIRLINEKIKELNTGGESKLLRDKRLGNLDVKYTKMPSIEAPIHLKVSKEGQQRLNGLKEVKAEIVYTIKTKIAKGQDISDEVAQLKDINLQIHKQEEDNRRESLLATMSGKSKIHSPYKNGSDNAIASDLSSAKTSVEAWNVLLDGMAQRHSEIIVSLGQLGNAFGGLGEAIGGNAGQWLKWMGNVTQAIGAAIPAITALTTAENLKASASGKAAAAGAASAMSFLGPIGAIAAIASVVAAITSIPKFATGGIVGGSSFYGDKILARVNSGELIANGDQQKRIWQQMEASRTTIIKQEVELGGSVTLRGQDLVIALARADRSRQR
jgi:hypothetical protein|nr:MAG TPA: Putative tail length tape measure protein [Caudoviricetes sp.]